MLQWFQVLIIALAADPNQIINEKRDPYASWVVAIAKAKKFLLPWYWGTR